MPRSAKYPLALIDKIHRTFPDLKLLIAYDIGCSFKKTLARSTIGATLDATWTIPAMHGYAHNRLCQLSHHPKYLDGTGIEDFETCERFFSSSNHCARTSRHATRFHRHQILDHFLAQWDEERYLSLGSFLFNNYSQALTIINDLTDYLPKMFAKLQLDPTDFPRWIDEEREYLTGLGKEPEEDTLRVAYVKALQELANLTAQDLPTTRKRSDPTKRTSKLTWKSAEAFLHPIYDTVLDLEARLNITPNERWEPGEPEYELALKYIRERDYNRALDNVARLLVQRLFELQKSQLDSTGYKLRVHLAKHLKKRSQTLRTALTAYNKAAKALTPPRPTVTFHEIIHYAWLSEFDLLRQSRHDIRAKPWAKPQVRVVVDQWFKLQRAREEQDRLNVEIARLRTWLRDDRWHWQKASTNPQLLKDFPALATEMQRRAQRHESIRLSVEYWLQKIDKLPGFSGSRIHGWSQEFEARGLSPADLTMSSLPAPARPSTLAPSAHADQEEEVAEEEDAAARAALERMDTALGQMAL